MGRFRSSLYLIWACLAVAAAATIPAHAETRLALVIDQTNYQNSAELSRVAQADYEADLIEAALRDTGFHVTRASDRTKSQLIDALDSFRIRLEQAGPDAVGFVYYTGHGAQHPGTRNSYLLGTDARLRAASDLASYGIDLEGQKDGFAATGAKAVILVFDACRNVATGSGFKANLKGMSRIEATGDMLIAYSTDLDDVAQEGIYAPVLAEEIRRQGQTAVTLFDNVQRRVAEKTGFRQKPWTNSRLYKQVCFAGCSQPQMALPSDEAVALGQALASSDVSMLNEFLRQFPQSRNRGLVERELASRSPSAKASPLASYLATIDLIALSHEGLADAADIIKHIDDSYSMPELISLAGGGNHHAEFWLGASFGTGTRNREDQTEANRLYFKACEGMYLIACTSLGAAYSDGMGVARDDAEANRLYRKACDGGEMLGCAALGGSYRFGKGVTKNLAETERLFRKACDGGLMEACSELAHGYRRGDDFPQNDAEAQHFLRKGCDFGDKNACNWLAN